MKYKHTVLGGTFDRLHAGHLSNLMTACENSEKVTVGLTTEKLTKNKILSEIILPYEERKKELLKIVGSTPGVDIVAIDDMFGPSISNPEFDRLIVTKNTLANGKKVNELRKKNNLKPVELVLAPYIYANDGTELSSTRIRRGEIDRSGFVYKTIFNNNVVLPHSLRKEMRKPLGLVFETTEKAASYLQTVKSLVNVSVGDIVSSSLKDINNPANISIIDYKNQRKNLASLNKKIVFDVQNEAGTIESKAALYIEKKIQEFFKNKKDIVIAVDGEEDLLVLPVVMFTPLSSIVLYGQKDVGIIAVEVTEEKKQFVRELLSSFTKNV